MEASRPYSKRRRSRVALAATLMFALALTFLGGCVHQPATVDKNPVAIGLRQFRVAFTVSRLKDHALLASVSLPLTLGQKAAVRTDLRTATEEKPALPEFAATLTTTPTPGVYQLISKIAIRETVRNKKGKLNISQRNQGALLPIHVGVPEVASPDGDPIQVEVKLSAK